MGGRSAKPEDRARHQPARARDRPRRGGRGNRERAAAPRAPAHGVRARPRFPVLAGGSVRGSRRACTAVLNRPAFFLLAADRVSSPLRRMFPPLELDPPSREALWKSVATAIEDYLRDLPSLPVSPSAESKAAARAFSRASTSRNRCSPEEAVALAVEGLRDHQVHNGHPRYFGLFNPATSTMSVAADALAAAFNPQLAAWTHAPFACEVEQLLIRTPGSEVRLPCPGGRRLVHFGRGGSEPHRARRGARSAISRLCRGRRPWTCRELPCPLRFIGEPSLFLEGGEALGHRNRRGARSAA